MAWEEFSALGYSLVIDEDEPGLNNDAYSGAWLVWLGGDEDETSIVSQSVLVPSAAPFLTYYKTIDSEDDCGYDYGSVLVNGTAVESYDLCFETETEWVKETVNLSAYAGQTVTIAFRATTDDSFTSSLLVDYVGFETSSTTSATETHRPDRPHTLSKRR